MSHLEYGSVAWVRLGQAWWPGTITTLEKCPPEFVEGIRKTPVAVVKFFRENEFHDVSKEEHIFPYSCERKMEFIKRGQYINKNQSHGEVDLLTKFESDVVTAEKLTGGDMNILETIGEVMGKRRVDYSDLGFGQPKAKKKKDEGSKRGTDIGQAVVYKKSGMKNMGNGKVQRVVIEHKVRILEQPKRETIEDVVNASNGFKCYVCGFTCTRLNVIVWHNKAHLKKVYDFDTGIKIPGRRKRKPGASKANKDGKKKGRTPKGKNVVDHSHTNGEVLGSPKEGNNTQQLLQDWDDEEEEVAGASGTASSTTANGRVGPSRGGDKNSDDGYSDDDGYPPPVPNHERRPMPKPADINSAFDALLATTPTSVVNSGTSQTSKYVSNDSDSDYSDWEKYYDKNSESDVEEEMAQESDIKSICEDGFEKSNGVKSEKDEEEEEEEDGDLEKRLESWDSNDVKQESTEAVSQGQSSEAVSQGQSSEAVSQGESSEAVSQGQSSEAVSQGESSEAVSQGESSEAVSQGESSEAVSQGQSSEVVSQGQSSEVVSQGLSSEAVSQGESSEAVSQGESSEAVSQGESSTLFKVEEEMSSKSTFSDSVESRSTSFEDTDKKDLKQEVDKPVQAVTQKSSADIYEYVDEFCESPQEPYEPPKKPYESLQKYRLLQDSSKARRESYTYDDEDDPSEDRESREAYEFDSEQESDKFQEASKAFKRSQGGPNVQQESQDELPDYESEEEDAAPRRKSLEGLPDYDSDEREDAYGGRRKDGGEIHESKSAGDNYETEDVYEPQKYRDEEDRLQHGDVYYRESPPIYEQQGDDRLHEEYDADKQTHIEGEGGYISAKSWDTVESSASGYHPSYEGGMVEAYESPIDQKFDESQQGLKRKPRSSKIYGFTHNSPLAVKAHEAFEEHQLEDPRKPRDSSTSEYSSSERYAQQGWYAAHEQYSEGDGVYKSDSDSREQGPLEHGKHPAESPRAIEEFIKDADQLAQNIDKLTENINIRPVPSAAIRDRVRKSLEERLQGDTQEIEVVLNLSTQDRSMVHGKAVPNTERSAQDASAIQSKVYHTKSGDHPVSSSSGTSYMLVAVDAQGNTVPTASTSSLSDGNSNLVAVEATLEDGATRTLYIDPTQLGPDVDMNNLMLHIDTSGQEHVILPSSSSSSEITGQEVRAYEAQGQRITDASSGESQAHRWGVSDSSGSSFSHRSESKSYHQISYAGNYGERYSSSREEDDHS